MTNNPQFLPIPQWAQKMVWYQIFPERFCRSNTHSNIDLTAIQGAWPHDLASPFEIHDWTADWHAISDCEQINGQDIWFQLQRRRYGGDLQGIFNKLDYLQELGITGIYLNPVFDAPSSHKYDGRVFHHIDPTLGPDLVGDRKLQEQEIPEDPSTWCWTQADLLMLELIEEIHNRGMRVIFDGVFNHLGQDSPFFRDVLKNGKKSKYAKWFTITRYGKGVNPNQGGWRYKCWEGFLELPELRQDQNGIVAGPREYIFSAVDRWMKPQGAVKQGIDGWRLDVAPKVAIPFWQEFRQRVRAANPEAYIVGEVFGGLSSTAPFLQGDTFDAVMNYEYAEAVNWFFLEEKLSATTMDNKLAVIRNAYHPAITLAMQNLHGSHDTDRVLSRIQNRQKFKYRNWGQYGGLSRGENRRYNGNKPDQTGEKIYWLMTIFQITYPGCPMIYYGDEVGMWGANDPGCRKPMIWSEFEYQQEKTQPHKSSKRKNDEVIVNQEIYQWMKQLIAIRHQEVALQLGDYSFLEQIRRPRTLVFTRSYNQDTLLIIIHCGERNVTVRNIPKGQWMDLLSGKSFNTNNNACRLTSRSALILKKVDHEN